MKLWLMLLVVVVVESTEANLRVLKDFRPTFDPIAALGENGIHVIELCDAIIKASSHKEIHILKSERNDFLDDVIVVLQRVYHHSVTVKTYTSLYTNAEENWHSCGRIPAQRKTKTAIKMVTKEEKLQKHFVFSVVLVLQPTESQLRDLLYSNSAVSSTIFILILPENPSITLKRIIRKAWRRKYIFRVIFVDSSQPSFVGTLYDPFSECEYDHAFVEIAITDRERITQALVANVHSLRGCKLKISMYARDQTAVLLENRTFTGQDGRLIDLLEEKMNFTPSINLMKGRMIYGSKLVNDTFIGTFANLIDGTADLSLNGHFMKDYQCDSVELTRQITSDRVCLLTPKSGVMPPLITVLKSFQLEVWAMIIATYVIVVVLYYLWTVLDLVDFDDHLSSSVRALDVFRVFTASPLNRKLRHHSERVLFAFCWCYSMVVLNSFQGSLVTFLNTPMHFPDIDTFEDLIKSNLPLLTTGSTFIELLLGDPTLSKLEGRIYVVKNDSAADDFEGHYAGFQRINVYNLKYFKDIKYVPNERDSRILHTMKQCIMSYFISYVLPRNSPYKRRIDEIISRVEHAGLLIKWNGDASKYIFRKYILVTGKDRARVKVFSVHDLEAAFSVILLGSGLSMCVFVLELGLNRRQRLAKIVPMIRRAVQPNKKKIMGSRRILWAHSIAEDSSAPKGSLLDRGSYRTARRPVKASEHIIY